MDNLVTQMIDSSSEALMDKVTNLVTMSPEHLAERLSKVVSCIDVSRIARTVGDTGSAESALDQARNIALELMGLK